MLLTLALIAAPPAVAQEPPAPLRVELTPDGGWQVLGGDQPLGAREFAQATGDDEMIARLDADLADAKTRTQALLGVGGGLVALAVVPLVRQPEENPPLASAYEVDQADYATQEEYLLAQEIADASFADAQIRYEVDIAAQREDRTWTAIALAGAGAMTLIAAPYARIGAQRRQLDASEYYTIDEARARIPAPVTIPEGPPPAAPIEPVDEAPAEPAPEDAEAPPAEDPPDEAAPDEGGPPAPPMDGAWLELRPAAAPGWIGVQGRF